MKYSKLAGMGMVLGLLSAAFAPGCGGSSVEPGSGNDVAPEHVRVDAAAIAALKPGESLTLDVRQAANFVYHVMDAKNLDLGRVVIKNDAGEVPAKDVIDPLLKAPYSPLEAANNEFVVTGNVDNFDELRAADRDILVKGKMLTIQDGKGPSSQPQTNNPCIDQAIYQAVSGVQGLWASYSVVACPPPSPSCNAASNGSSNYLFCNYVSSWDNAQAYCASQSMHLAVINDKAEEDFIYGTANGYSTQKWWIGLNDRDVEGQYVWDGGSSSYVNWAPGEPNNAGNEDCGQINRYYPTHGWNDEPCYLAYRFVCEQ